MFAWGERHPRLLFGILSTGLILSALLTHLAAASVLLPHYARMGMDELPAPTHLLSTLGAPGMWAFAGAFLLGIAASMKAKEGRLFPLLPTLIFGLGMLFFLACSLGLVFPLCLVHGH